MPALLSVNDKLQNINRLKTKLFNLVSPNLIILWYYSIIQLKTVFAGFIQDKGKYKFRP